MEKLMLEVNQVLVFLCSIITIFLILTIGIISSYIDVEITNLKVNDINDLYMIVRLIKEKRYIDIFRYVYFNIKIKVKILNIISFINFKYDNNKIKDKIEKFEIKQLEQKNNIKKEKTKSKIKKIGNELEKYYKLEKLKLNISIGTKNATITAIITTTINIIISLLIPCIEKPKNVKSNNYLYYVEPVYLDKPVFNLEANCKIKFSMLKILKDMYI